MRGQKKLILGIIDADTESTKEGYLSAFIASKVNTRFEMSFPPGGSKPTKKYLKQKEQCFQLISTIPERFESTNQKEIREYFDNLQLIMDQINLIVGSVKSGKTVYEAFLIMNFANVGWDIDVLRGIIFPGSDRVIEVIGTDSDMVQLRFGHLLIRDFLRITGFSSIKMAGQICKTAHKLDGVEVYEMTKDQIPEHFDDYSETKKDYIRNDVAVMDESLNVFLNQPANLCIQKLDQLPMTLTGFSRFRQQHLDEIIMVNGQKVNSSYQITNYRWQYARPYILYLIDAFKGGYCGPNPHIQYKILKNGICYDAVSMYPDKMCAFRQLQCTKDSVMLRTTRTFEEIGKAYPEITEDERLILRNFSDCLEFFDKIDNEGFQPARIDDANGIYGWICTITMRIKGVRRNSNTGALMMPFLSSYKSENEIRTEDHVITANGKVISADRFTIKLSCVDLILTMMCYDLDVISIDHMLTMGWKGMLPVQKKSVKYGYGMKMTISEILKLPREEQRDYWEGYCGFNFESIQEMNADDFSIFSKTYKQMIKAIPNGEYGKTVEKPIHPQSRVEINADGIPVILQESPKECMKRVMYWMQCKGGFLDRYGNPIEHDETLEFPPTNWGYPVKDEDAIPENVKCNDYCAGSSITMWSRWQLVSMMYILFKHGYETWYCDTDSIFTEDCPEVRKLFERFNEWKNTNWKWYVFDQNAIFTSEQLDSLGTFGIDKVFSLFCTLGAKNYCFVSKKDQKIHLTIAGLNTRTYETILNQMKEDQEVVIYKYYHPNIFIEPSGCRKLVKTRETCHFDEDGTYCGCVLVPYGFAMIATKSKFHINNLARAEDLQNLPKGTYTGKWIDKIYLSEKGFSESPTEETCGYEAFVTVEDQTRFIQGKEVVSYDG